MLKQLVPIAAIVSLFITLSRASCDCRWKLDVYGIEAVPISDMQQNEINMPIRLTVKWSMIQIFAYLMCDNKTASRCSDIKYESPLKTFGAKTSNSGCYMNMNVRGQIDHPANGSNIDFSGTPKGCPVVRRSINVTMTNPNKYVNSVMLLNGQVWPADDVEKQVSISSDKPETFTFTSYNPSIVFNSIYLSKLGDGIGTDKQEKRFNETNRPLLSDIPSHLRISEINSTTLSVRLNTVSQRRGYYTTLGFTLTDGISTSPTSYSIRFTNGVDQFKANGIISVLAVILSILLAIFQ